jgi:hypothetical protein
MSKSKLTNINWSKQYKKWHVRITIDGQRIHIGRYQTLEEARTALREATTEDDL